MRPHRRGLPRPRRGLLRERCRPHDILACGDMRGRPQIVPRTLIGILPRGLSFFLSVVAKSTMKNTFSEDGRGVDVVAIG